MLSFDSLMSPATIDGSTIYFRKWHPDIHLPNNPPWRGFSNLVRWTKEDGIFHEQSFDFSFEDPRAFLFRGQTHLIFHNQKQMVLWNLIDGFVPLKPPSGFMRHDEKNWSPYQYPSNDLILVYSISPLVVLICDPIEGKIITELGEKKYRGLIGNARGGTPFLNGKALGHHVELRPTIGNDIRWYTPFAVELDIRNLSCILYPPFEFEQFRGHRIQFPTTLTENLVGGHIDDSFSFITSSLKEKDNAASFESA
ncbi:hypothetical protein GpartN1_g1935.t1 [Galdieria partita]|uniref:Uncharacterized protein n=1 Tax=Galdieria partita TaxID=83374 RepID=A0A9C7PTY3_9RHOD|nr:hypothetical protein GpartN1_g1935.t1 [Galdieria partita]